jgi:hypothetical protein
MGTAAQIGAKLTLSPVIKDGESSVTLVPDELEQRAAE